MEATDPTWNANNSEIEHATRKKNDFEMAITPSPDTVHINVVDTGTKVTFSGITMSCYTKHDQHSLENCITETPDNISRSITDTKGDLEKETMTRHKVTHTCDLQHDKDMLELTEIELQNVPTHDIKYILGNQRSPGTESTDMFRETLDNTDDLHDVDIQITLGDCPGTIHIDVVDRREQNPNRNAVVWKDGGWIKQIYNRSSFKDMHQSASSSTLNTYENDTVPPIKNHAMATYHHHDRPTDEQRLDEYTDGNNREQRTYVRVKKQRYRSNSGDCIITCNGTIDVEKTPNILDDVDSLIPRIAPKKLKHVQLDVPKLNKYYSKTVEGKENANLKWLEFIMNKKAEKLINDGTRTHVDDNGRTVNVSRPAKTYKYPEQTNAVPHRKSNTNTPSENNFTNGRGNVINNHDSDKCSRSRQSSNKQRSPQMLADKVSSRRYVISFTEEELIYRAEQEHPANVPKQSQSSHGRMIILKKGESLDSYISNTIAETDDHNPEIRNVGRQENNNIRIPMAKINKYQPQPHYEQKHNTQRSQEEKYPHSKIVKEREAKRIAEENDARQRANKNKKRRNKSKGNNGSGDVKNIMKGAPRTRLEKFQRDIESGIVRPIFTKHRSGGLKRMKLQRELHHGSFATTLKAVYMNEDVAVTIYSEDVNNVDLLQLIQLNRSNFVLGLKDNLRGSGTDLWLIHKFLPLGDLQHVLARDRHRDVLGERHARFIAVGLLLGLDYLHQNNVIHGNLKPSKILFNNHGFPVLTGFRAIAHSENSEQACVDVYTMAYSSPDRLRGQRDAAVDIFSLGCVAYEIVTGRTPFDGYGEYETRENILNIGYRPVYEPDQFSFAGELFIDSCLRKFKSQRFTTGRNLINMKREEWFSSLNMKMLKRQMIDSPLLEAFRCIQDGVPLNSDQKYVNYNWGSVMDVICPNTPAIMFC